MGDLVTIHFWNRKIIKKATTKTKPLAVCHLTVGDIYSSILRLHREQLRHREFKLSREGVVDSRGDRRPPHPSRASIVDDFLFAPPIQEFCLNRPCKASRPTGDDLFDAISKEMASIQKAEEVSFNLFDSDSSDSGSDSSFLGGNDNIKEENLAAIARVNERLFGSVYLSFFPVLW